MAGYPVTNWCAGFPCGERALAGRDRGACFSREVGRYALIRVDEEDPRFPGDIQRDVPERGERREGPLLDAIGNGPRSGRRIVLRAVVDEDQHLIGPA